MFLHIGEGVIRAVIFTIIAILIFSIIVGDYKSAPPAISSAFYIVITTLSIIYGSIFATRKINKNGWINGLFVAGIYLVIMLIISIGAGHEATLGINNIVLRFIIGLAVGMLSGMLGINI